MRAELESLDKAEQVIAYIQERAGLLQARDNRTYAFPHRTFQEYLAATHILKQSEFDTMLRDRVRRDLTWWREVFLLAAGASGSTPRIISDLVDCLVFKGPEQEMVSPNKAQQVQAIAQALVETDFAEHVRKERINEPGRFSTTYERIQKWLIAAVRSAHTLAARERAACGDTLARLGDPRFRPEAWYLPDEPLLGFVEILDGPFLMGSNRKRDSEAYDNELKQHKVTLLTYYIARYPVTVAQFQSFVSESRDTSRDPRSLQGLANHPVVYATWHDALAYCEWLTEQLRNWQGTPEPLASLLNKQGWRVTLPSEAEWEKAARGSDGRIYP